jgi:hypothetical protein
MEISMKMKGIRISDGIDSILRVKLSDILEEVVNGNSFHWVVLFLDGTPNQGQGKLLSECETLINKSKNGLPISWEELNLLSSKFSQMFETTILGCKDANLLYRYKKEAEMYKTCDIVLDLIDCAFWEVYSKDGELIARLAKKFKEIEFLEPNFENDK